MIYGLVLKKRRILKVTSALISEEALLQNTFFRKVSVQCMYLGSFGAFAKLRKTTISFVIFARLPAWSSSAPAERNLMILLVEVFTEI